MFEQGVYSFQAKCVCYYEVLFESFLLPISTYHCRIPFLSMSLIMAVVGHESFWYFCLGSWFMRWTGWLGGSAGECSCF